MYERAARKAASEVERPRETSRAEAVIERALGESSRAVGGVPVVAVVAAPDAFVRLARPGVLDREADALAERGDLLAPLAHEVASSPPDAVDADLGRHSQSRA